MTFLPLVGAGALLLATPALARQPVATSVNVSHADLDLSTSRGLAALDHRIARAAREACGYASAIDLAGTNRVRDCREQARTVASVRRDELAAAARQVEVAAGR